MQILVPNRRRTSDTLFERPTPAPAGPSTPQPRRPVAPRLPATARGVARRIRAWMVVLPVDAALLLAPLLWAPQQRKAILTLAVLALLLVTGGRRYRARLHLSVLDELPALVGRLLTAGALVATVIALRHEQEAVTTFLVNAAIMRRPGGRGPGRDEPADRLEPPPPHHRAPHVADRRGRPGRGARRHPARAIRGTGSLVVGFVDDGTDCVAEAVVPHLGHLNELDRVVGETGADVLLVADGDFSERYLLDAVRTPACLPCDLLVVPRMHHFAPQTGPGDHIGSIPVMRIRTPNLQGPAWLIKRAFDIVAAALLLVLAAPVIAGLRARRAPRGRSRCDLPTDPGRAGRSALRLPEAPVDAPGRRDRVGDHLVGRPTTAGSARSGASCGARRSTSCRSCGTSCAAT